MSPAALFYWITLAGVALYAVTGVLDAGRKLRNGFSHPEGQDTWSYGMAGPAIRTSHAVVSHLFAD